ncbi:MAG: glycosyltransferase family 2 protein [Niabella sp.]
MSLVSVNVISYNQAPYLQQRIESVLQQSFNEYELIIWDDASTDHSYEIIEQYRLHKKASRIIFNDKNSGNGYLQWQKVINACKSKYIWLAEGDDFAEPDFLKKTVAFMEANPTAALVEVDSFYVKNEEKNTRFSEYKNLNFPHPEWQETILFDGKEYLLKNLTNGNSIINVSSVLFRTEALQSVKTRFYDFKFSGDWALYIELCKKWNVGYLHEVLSNFRIHSTNHSKTGVANGTLYKENFKIITQLFQYLKKEGVSTDEYLKPLSRYITVFGVPFKAKLSLINYYFKTNPLIAIKGLFYNFKNRFFTPKNKQY